MVSHIYQFIMSSVCIHCKSNTICFGGNCKFMFFLFISNCKIIFKSVCTNWSVFTRQAYSPIHNFFTMWSLWIQYHLLTHTIGPYMGLWSYFCHRKAQGELYVELCCTYTYMYLYFRFIVLWYKYMYMYERGWHSIKVFVK